ncbi:MAG TPA: dienelactone hydrolase family protein [Gemmatimonadales bacterium]|nr:dienelactone hydrolase family protein [Gemmatimonadales bacterium]
MNRKAQRDGSGRTRVGSSALFGGLGVGAAVLIAALPFRPDIHAEYVKYRSGADTITAYLAYPERPDPAPGVIVIHEIFGLSDFIRETTEQLARDGFVAIAPDLLSRRGGTPAAGEDARRLIVSLPPDSVTLDLDATFAYLKTLKAVRGDRIGVIGFCWGGGQSFRYATNNPNLGAFVVCYGPGPNLADVGRIRAPGLGVYAENDARINASLPEVAAAMRQAGKAYRYAVYPGTGHGFLRSRDNPAAADSAWRAVVGFFEAELGK